MEDVPFFPRLLQFVLRDPVATRGTILDVSVELFFSAFLDKQSPCRIK